MMQWSHLTRTRVNPLVPAAIAILGCIYALAASWTIGAGVAIGAALAYINGVVLSRRVDVASLTGNVAGALMVMQAGLLVTLGIVAAVTVVLVKISVAMTVACAAGFAVTHLIILATFYFTQARTEPLPATGAVAETEG